VPPRGSPPGPGTCSSRSALPPISVRPTRAQGPRKPTTRAAAGGAPLTGEEGAEADDGNSAAGGGDGGEVGGAGELGEGAAASGVTGCGRRGGGRHGAAVAGGRRRELRQAAEAGSGEGESGSEEGRALWGVG